MFLEFLNKKISNSHKLLSDSKILALFYQPLPFLSTLPHILKNKQNFNPHPLCKVEEMQL